MIHLPNSSMNSGMWNGADILPNPLPRPAWIVSKWFSSYEPGPGPGSGFASGASGPYRSAGRLAVATDGERGPPTKAEVPTREEEPECRKEALVARGSQGSACFEGRV